MSRASVKGIRDYGRTARGECAPLAADQAALPRRVDDKHGEVCEMEIPLRRTSAAVTAIALALGGCATVPEGSPPQSLAVSTTHELSGGGPTLGWGSAPRGSLEELTGAQCTAANDRGSWTLVTPGVLAVDRSTARLRITCRKEGYREAVVDLPCAVPGTEAGRLAPLLGPGILVIIPAIAIGAIVAANREGAERGVCAYGGGYPVQVQMER
jgi:hypothetical protein